EVSSSSQRCIMMPAGVRGNPPGVSSPRGGGVLSMRSHTEYLTFNTKKEREHVNITGQVAGAVEKSRVKEGLCLVAAMHITAGVYVNDDEPGFRADLDEMLERLAPSGLDYRHHETSEADGDA